MAYSGTYAFTPALGDVVLNAFSRIGLRRTSLTAEHMQDAAIEANLQLVEISNLQPNLWTSEGEEIALVEGQATYTLPAYTVMVTIGVIRTNAGTEQQQDRVIFPVSTYEYQAYPNKLQQGTPTTYWFNRQITPEITLWQVPDGNGPYVLRLQTVRQVQDAVMAGGLNVEVPYRFQDAFTAGLANRLARIYAPERLAETGAEAKRTWDIAATQDTENVGLYLVPGVQTYYRN